MKKTPLALTPAEREAMELYTSGKSQMKAYMATHPNTNERLAQWHASAYFKRIRQKIRNMPYPKLFELFDIGLDSYFSKLKELLEAKKAINRVDSITWVPDNDVQFKALQELARLINPGEKPAEQDNTIKIIIDL